MFINLQSTMNCNKWASDFQGYFKGEHNFGLHLKSVSMEPEFKEGEVIIICPTAKAVIGDYVVAKNDEEEATFMQYKKFDSARVLHPLVLNKDLEYRIVWVVMEKKKRYK